MDEERQLKTDRYSHDTEELCFVSVLEQFVRSAEAMEETILFPSVLMDSTVNNLETDLSPSEVYLNEGMDLRTFCLTMKSLRIQLTQGRSYIQEGVEENIRMGNKIEELCLQLRPVIRHARYLGYASQEIALSNKPLSFQEFTALEFERALLCKDHSTLNLRETLQLFMNAVEEMEQETLFPNLLKSFRASDYGFSLNEEQSLNQLYISIVQVRSVLVAPRHKHFPDFAICEMIAKLKTVLCSYTTMINKVTEIYRQKFHEDF